MTQSLDSLVIGTDYLLEFSYKPRTNNKNDNGISVFWYDTATDFNFAMNADFSVNSRRKKQPDWVIKSVTLTAQYETMDLSCAAFGKQNSLGGLVDNVSLVQMKNTALTNIPEPSALALSLLGFVLLIASKND